MIWLVKQLCAAAGTVASPASTNTTAPMLRHKERTKELYMVFIVGSKKW
jgi:hypothetical protein